MEALTQQIIGGLTLGLIYALIALGFTITLRASDLVSFAQGELVMTGAFVGYTLLQSTPLPYVAVFLLTSLIVGLLGAVVELGCLRRIRLARAPLLNLLIATIGVGIVLRVVALLIWGANPLRYPSVFPSEPLALGPVRVSPLNIWIIVLGLASMLALQFFFQRTLTGTAWRAASLDPSTAELMGVDFNRTVTLTFGISSALAGAAGVLIAPLFFVSTDLFLIGPRAFAAAAIGAWHLVGTMFGGAVLGLTETLAAGLVSSGLKNAIAYFLMIVILMVVAVPKIPAGAVAREGREQIPLRNLLPFEPSRLLRWRLPALAATLGLALLVPLLLPQVYLLHILTVTLIYAIGALGLQLIVGYTGALVFGYAAFFGIGAYASALLSLRLGVPPLLAMPLAGLVTAAVGGVLGIMLRLPGHYLAIASLGLGEIISLVMINWTPVTNGAIGLTGIPHPSLGPVVFDDVFHYYYLALFGLLLALGVLRRVIDSRFGRALVAVRENALAASATGIGVTAAKIQAFMIGTAFAGCAGGLFAHYITYISPDSFTLSESINWVTMVVLGGLGSLSGAVAGAFLVSLAPEVMRGLDVFRVLIYGLLLVVFMMYLPGGLADVVRQILLLGHRFGLAGRAARRGDQPVPEQAREGSGWRAS
ncbi:MAG: ABC transporter permease [Chloroflexi bacterium]|nr:ABC transporter permease [Chloroflexota bacterium]